MRARTLMMAAASALAVTVAAITVFRSPSTPLSSAGSDAATLAPARTDAATLAPAGTGAVPLPPCQEQRSVLNVPGHAPGGPVRLLPAGAIRAIEAPAFEAPAAARTWLGGDAPVLVLRVGADVRAYPLAILLWHEVVNDTVGGRPVAVTYCPLCNTGTVYARAGSGETLDLQASGKLLLGAAILQDRRSGTQWLQPTGEWAGGNRGVIDLHQLPSDQQSLDEARRTYPALRVLSRDTGFQKPYGTSPYGATGRIGTLPSLFDGDLDRRLAPKTRVLGAHLGDVAYAWTYPALRQARISERQVAGNTVLAIFRPQVGSIGDSDRLLGAPDVGSTGLFDARIGGRTLHFRSDVTGAIQDRETGSSWTNDGLASRGPLRGSRLAVLAHLDTYWYVWASFYPDTQLWPGFPAGTCTP